MGAVYAMVALILAGVGLLACETTSPFEAALTAVRSGDRTAAEAIVAAEADPVARDMLRLNLATEEPAKGAFLCAAVTTPDAKEKCAKVLGRPHLNGAAQ